MKKLLIFGIIVLFIGVAFIPSFNAISISILENHPPDKPTIKGKIMIEPGTTYDYKFKATDPDGDNIRYYIHWDDGYTQWTDYYPSGEEIIVNHTWKMVGVFYIKARANDTHGALGPWGYIKISKDKAITNSPLLRFLERYPLLIQFIQRLSFL